MNPDQVNYFLTARMGDFPPEYIPQIRQALLGLSDQAFVSIQMIDFKNPTTALILSIFLGYLGIDRFYIGDIGMGIGKLLTGGGCGIWTIVDWFLIMGATRQKNYAMLYDAITRF